MTVGVASNQIALRNGNSILQRRRDGRVTEDSEIVATQGSSDICVSRKGIDALHILTFAVVEAIDRTILRPR